MARILRDYQSAALDALWLYWRTGGGNGLIVLPTASGKSLAIAALCRELLAKYAGMRILIVTHVRELLSQNHQELIEAWPDAPAGLYSAGLNRRDTGCKITIAGVQSVFRKPDLLGAIDLVIVDEAHLIGRRSASMYGQLFAALKERVPDLRVAGLTATPFRLDSGRLDQGKGKLFDDIVHEAKIPDLMEAGFLAKARLLDTGPRIDVSGVGIRSGEYIVGELEHAAMAGNVVAEACAELVRLAEGRKSILAFCCGVDHAHAVRDGLRDLGVTAEAVWGDMDAGERDRIVTGFREGRIRAVTNINVLSTGYNAPGIDCIAMLRPTMSTGLYVQQIGRGFRIAPGKDDFVVLDFAGNVRRHGPIDDPVIGKQKSDSSERAKECTACHALNALSAKTCIWCSVEFPVPQKGEAQERSARHAIRASGGALFAAELESTAVSGWSFRCHQKVGKPDSLRVIYRCGLLGHSEWICLEHGAGARWRARQWWMLHGGRLPVPATVDEALLRVDELTMPVRISLRRDGDFWRICGREFERNAA